MALAKDSIVIEKKRNLIFFYLHLVKTNYTAKNM